MNSLLHIRIYAAFSMLLGVFSCGQSWGALPVIPLDVQNSIKARVDYGYCPAIVAGVVNAEGRAYFSYGNASLETGTAATEETLFEIGSITKVLTASLLAVMANSGDLSLTDLTGDFLPSEVQAPSRNGIEINLLHLATHTSGLPATPPNLENPKLANPFAGYDREHLYDLLNTFVLPRNPGAQYEYTNVGFGLLGELLARRAGLDYEQALKTRLLHPLGMNDTTISLTSEQQERRAAGYSGVAIRPPFFMNSLAAAGDVVSSAREMLTFLEFHCGIRDHDLKPALVSAMTSRRATDLPGVNIGLGWWMFNPGGGDIVMHGGNTVGQTAFVGFRRNSKRAVVVLTNARVNQFANIQDIGLRLIDSSLPLTAIPKPPVLSADLKQKFQGIYRDENGFWFSVDQRHDFLTVTTASDTSGAFTLVPQNSRQFTILEPGLTVTATFNTNGTGKATSLSWTQNSTVSQYARAADLPKLKISGSDPLFIEFNGETSMDFILEVSPDMSDWVRLTSSFNQSGFLVEADTEFKFFRAKLE